MVLTAVQQRRTEAGVAPAAPPGLRDYVNRGAPHLRQPAYLPGLLPAAPGPRASAGRSLLSAAERGEARTAASDVQQ